MLAAGRMGGERGGRAAAHLEDPAVGTSATELPHIAPEKVRKERLRSQTESGCDHRAAGSAAGHSAQFWRPMGAFVFIGLGEGGECPRRHSRIRLSRLEGRTELRGRGSEPLSRGHRNTCHRCLLVCNNTTKSLIFGSPVDPGVIPGGALGPRRGSLALLRLWARQLDDRCAHELRACFLVACAPQFHRPGRPPLAPRTSSPFTRSSS